MDINQAEAVVYCRRERGGALCGRRIDRTLVPFERNPSRFCRECRAEVLPVWPQEDAPPPVMSGHDVEGWECPDSGLAVADSTTGQGSGGYPLALGVCAVCGDERTLR